MGIGAKALSPSSEQGLGLYAQNPEMTPSPTDEVLCSVPARGWPLATCWLVTTLGGVCGLSQSWHRTQCRSADFVYRLIDMVEVGKENDHYHNIHRHRLVKPVWPTAL